MINELVLWNCNINTGVWWDTTDQRSKEKKKGKTSKVTTVC